MTAKKIEIRRKTATTYEVQSSRDPNLYHRVEINPETDGGICSCPGDGSIARAGTGNQCRHVKAVFKMTAAAKKEAATTAGSGPNPETAVAIRDSMALGAPAPGAAVVPFMPSREDMRGMMELANFLAGAQMLPKGITKSQDVMMLLLYGRQLGIDPMTASQKLFVIDGRIGMYAEMMLALAKANEPTLEAKFEWSDADGGSCTCDLWRNGKSVQKVTYTGKMADAAGQTKKGGPWQSYRRDMLAWNACKRALRLGAPELYLAIQPRGLAAQVQTFEDQIIEGSAVVIEDEADALPLPASAGATTAAEYAPPVAPATGTGALPQPDPGPKPASAGNTPDPAEPAPKQELSAERATVLRDLLKRAASELPADAWTMLRTALSQSYGYALAEGKFAAGRLTPADGEEAIEDVARIVNEAVTAGGPPATDPDDLPFS